MCAEITETRAGVVTVSFEFARRSGNNRYDWPNKFIIQLTDNELPSYFACISRRAPLPFSVEYHGSGRNKSMQVRENPDCSLLYVGLCPGSAIALPVPTPDVYWLAAQAATALQASHPGVSALGIVTAITP